MIKSWDGIMRKTNKQELITQLEIAGAVVRGNTVKCPYHDDKRASAGVFMADNGWYFKCQACGAKGDVWDIQAKNENTTVRELMKTCEPKTKIYKSLDDLKYDKEAVYRYTNLDGKVELAIIRTKDKKFIQCRPVIGGWELKAPLGKLPIYNRTRVSRAEEVYVVEGEKCVHHLHKLGIVATTSPCGSNSADRADWSLLAGKKVVLWPDNDEPGRKYMSEVEKILTNLDCDISVVKPEELGLNEKDDCCDYTGDYPVKTHSKKPTSGVLNILKDTISGKRSAITWPYANLSRLTKALMPGTVSIICGNPGASKSFMLLECFSHWLFAGVKTAMYALEENKEYHLLRMLSQESGEPMCDPDWVKNNPDRAMEVYEGDESLLEVIAKNLWACPERQLTLGEIAEWSLERAKAGYRIICIDPITAAASTTKPWIEDNLFLNTIKKIATDYNCSYILVTHPTKSCSLPELNQLAGSAAYGRFVQTAMWLNAHDTKTSNVRTSMGTVEYEHNRTLGVLKARNGMGQGMTLACEFEGLRLREYGVIVKEKK